MKPLTSITATLFIVAASFPVAEAQMIKKNICAMSACAAMTTEFRDGTLRPRTVALLPVQAQLYKKGVFASDELVSEARPLEDSLAEQLTENIAEQGYEVRRITHEEVGEDEVLSDLLTEAEARFEQEYQLIADTKLKGVKYRRFSVGDPARLLASYLGVDALVFTRLQAEGQTGANAVFGVSQGGELHAATSYVHVRTGDIEALFGGRHIPFGGKSIEKLIAKPAKHTAKLAEMSTRKLPEVDEVLKPEKLDQEQVRAVKLYDQGGDSDVLADMQDLLAD